MYKLVLYYVLVILIAAVVFCLFGVLSYSPLALIFSAVYITIICLLTNLVFSWAFRAPTNTESVYITAIILALIITPLSSPTDWVFFSLATWASILAMASKYILAIGKKHIFNPAAIALVLTAIFLNQNASWWVGSAVLSPVVLIGGLLLVKKILRFDLVISFLATALIVTVFSFVQNGIAFGSSVWTALTSTSILFFAFVMLTEPLTTPPTRVMRIAYGIIAGLLYWPSLHVGNFAITPVVALALANIFSYIVSPKQKLLLTLKEKIQYGDDTYHFVFTPDHHLEFEAGQYLEWTLDRKGTDSRGNRRYFTIASAPTEAEVGLGVRFFPNSSSFKKHLLEMEIGETLVASQLAGEFVLPRDFKDKKFAFLAGGIGVTPFRSIIKNLVDEKEKVDIVQLYSNKFFSDVAYKDVFDDAYEKLGIRTVYVVTDESDSQYTGRISTGMIGKEIPDYLDRYFYLSGPHQMVTAFEETLKDLGVKRSQIKTDFFPGFM